MFNANNSSMDDTCSTFVPYKDSSKEMNNTVKSIMIIFFLFFKRIIQYNIGRKIRKFNPGQKNKILIKKRVYWPPKRRAKPIEIQDSLHFSPLGKAEIKNIYFLSGISQVTQGRNMTIGTVT